MDYKIGDVSALFGLSTETLRNYERAGLITSKREGSYFRCYDMDTVRKLVGLRTQRNEGFSIQELQRIYHDVTIREYHDLVREKLEVLERQVTYEALILERLRQVEGKIAAAQEHPDRLQELQSPAFYVLPYGVDSFIDMEGLPFQQLAAWTRNLFLVQHMHTFGEGVLDTPQKETVSMVIEVDMAERLGLPREGAVYLQYPQHCVHCSCLKRADQEVFDLVRRPLRDYLEGHRLQVADRPFYISTFTFHEKGESVACMDVYVPVKRQG